MTLAPQVRASVKLKYFDNGPLLSLIRNCGLEKVNRELADAPVTSCDTTGEWGELQPLSPARAGMVTHRHAHSEHVQNVPRLF